MTTTRWLRIAAIISLLFTVGHTLGGRKQWSPMGDNDVLRQMTSVHFATMGATRSYLDFFMGFGWSLSIAMALQAVLLWQLATLARADPRAVRPMIGVFLLAAVASGLIAWRYIFAVPAAFEAALALALLMAYRVASQTATVAVAYGIRQPD